MKTQPFTIDTAGLPNPSRSGHDRRQISSVRNVPPFKAGWTLARATFFACLLLALPFEARPQGSISFGLDWFSLDGGGGQSSGGDFVLWGTLGQLDAGEQSGGDYRLVGGFWGIVLQAQDPDPQPAVHITRTPDGVMISWPGTAASFQLQETLSLASPISWDAVPQTPVLVNDEYTVTVPATAGARFFRLRRP